jgi:hypothetical protein
MSIPTFNHTRADGLYDPCPKCRKQMNLRYAEQERVRLHPMHIARRGTVVGWRFEGEVLVYHVLRDGNAKAIWVEDAAIASLKDPVPESFVLELEYSLELSRWVAKGNEPETFLDTPIAKELKPPQMMVIDYANPPYVVKR